jgi:hypothetical protein
MKYLTILTILLFCTMSSEQKGIEEEVFTIPFARNMSNQKEIGLKEIAKNIEYIALEYKPEAAIGSIGEIIATEKYLFVAGKEVFQFSRTGEFIRKIGKQGKGPGEYPVVVDLSVDEQNQKIYILAAMTNQILVYDFNGTSKNAIHLTNRGVERIDILENGIIALQSGFILNPAFLTTEIINEQGESLYQFNSNISKSNNPSIEEGRTANVVYQFNNNFFVKECKNDTVYKITKTGLVPYFTFDLGKYKPPVVGSEMEWGPYAVIYKIFETENYIIALFIHKNSGCVARYNKTTKEVIVSIPFENPEIGIKNDFDNGANFFLTMHDLSYKSTLNEWVLPLNTSSLLKYKDNPSITGNFKAMANKLNENDNPVIMIVKTK